MGITFFVGSVLFTSAAALQLGQAMAHGARLDRLAAAVQFAGTLFFNVTTFASLNGAVCFLAGARLLMPRTAAPARREAAV